MTAISSCTVQVGYISTVGFRNLVHFLGVVIQYLYQLLNKPGAYSSMQNLDLEVEWNSKPGIRNLLVPNFKHFRTIYQIPKLQVYRPE